MGKLLRAPDTIDDRSIADRDLFRKASCSRSYARLDKQECEFSNGFSQLFSCEGSISEYTRWYSGGMCIDTVALLVGS